MRWKRLLVLVMLVKTGGATIIPKGDLMEDTVQKNLMEANQYTLAAVEVIEKHFNK